MQPVLHRYTCIADFNRNAVFFYCLAVVMVMDNPNSYARPIKHLEKGMDFGVSSKCFYSVYRYIIEKNHDKCCCRGKIMNILQNKECILWHPFHIVMLNSITQKVLKRVYCLNVIIWGFRFCTLLSTISIDCFYWNCMQNVDIHVDLIIEFFY